MWLHQTIPMAKISISHRSSSALSRVFLFSSLLSWWSQRILGEKKAWGWSLQHQQKQMGFACRMSLDSPQRLQVSHKMLSEQLLLLELDTSLTQQRWTMFCCAEAERGFLAFISFIKMNPPNELLYENWSLTPHRFSFACFMVCTIVWVSFLLTKYFIGVSYSYFLNTCKGNWQVTFSFPGHTGMPDMGGGIFAGFYS